MKGGTATLAPPPIRQGAAGGHRGQLTCVFAGLRHEGDCALYAGPPDEYPRLAACLQAEGFVAEVVEGGQALEYSYGSEAQRSASAQAKADCDQEIGVPPPPETLSEREIGQRYAFLVEARACFIAAGHDLPEPPSDDATVESWVTNPWSPFNDLPFMSTEA